MGNVLKLFRSWFSHSDERAKQVTVVEQPILTRQPVYSWDKKANIEVSQFRLDHLNDEHIHRMLVDQGQQLTIESCSSSFITSSGYSDSVFIDDCKDCKIILGPVKGSIFLRNCSRCVVVLACGQLRTRDCNDITCYLFCASQPSIETSVMFKFHCISLDYPGFRDQLVRAGLDPLGVNRWSDVFDFTPTSFSNNWKILTVEDRVENHLTERELTHCTNHQIAFDQTVSVVSFTHPALKISGKENNVGWDISDRFYNLVETNHDQQLPHCQEACASI